jgi:hypothetical protein
MHAGLSFDQKILPHSPYKNPEGALITAWYLQTKTKQPIATKRNAVI